jgi:hypothetical protein
MGVFLCWSGENSRSHQIAKILDKRIPEILQTADTFLSSADIPPGTHWMDELMRAINNNSFGILCITPENKEYPWLHFEAGALWRGGEKDRRVCPLLYDLRPAQISGPLSQLQGKELLNRDEFFEVVKAVNQYGALHKIEDESRLRGYFDRVWPDIQNDLSNVTKPPNVVDPEPNYKKMIEEILTIVRYYLPARVEAADRLSDLVTLMERQIVTLMELQSDPETLEKLKARARERQIAKVLEALERGTTAPDEKKE